MIVSPVRTRSIAGHLFSITEMFRIGSGVCNIAHLHCPNPTGKLVNKGLPTVYRFVFSQDVNGLSWRFNSVAVDT